MKRLSSLFLITIFLSPVAIAADGATDSTIISDLKNNGAVIAIEGEGSAGPAGVGAKGDFDGKTTAGSITFKGSSKRSTVITSVKNNGVVTCVGNATCGSVTYDFTN